MNTLTMSFSIGNKNKHITWLNYLDKNLIMFTYFEDVFILNIKDEDKTYNILYSKKCDSKFYLNFTIENEILIHFSKMMSFILAFQFFHVPEMKKILTYSYNSRYINYEYPNADAVMKMIMINAQMKYEKWYFYFIHFHKNAKWYRLLCGKANLIKRAWFRANTNPEYLICQKRLKIEFANLI